MVAIDPRIDEYISKAADFAKPILTHLRNVVHTACPDVVETMKWAFPHFQYAGGILCSMAAFKQHCAFGFWLGSKMKDPDKLLAAAGERTAMGHFGQIKSLGDLPTDEILIKYIKEAMALNEDGVKITKKANPAVQKDIEVPSYFLDALKQRPAALTAFEKFSPSHKKEYVEWITEAKTEVTRSKRIANAVEWIGDGKSRHWKYNK